MRRRRAAIRFPTQGAWEREKGCCPQNGHCRAQHQSWQRMGSTLLSDRAMNSSTQESPATEGVPPRIIFDLLCRFRRSMTMRIASPWSLTLSLGAAHGNVLRLQLICISIGCCRFYCGDLTVGCLLSGSSITPAALVSTRIGDGVGGRALCGRRIPILIRGDGIHRYADIGQ
uniref:Uncharacterized protein n=1 Tax=Candidatus Kentrum eta TaxID=2126337 RepID=A0A450V334_9GAMM|nr:MAG: hypothetical protein BECKH772A_GA0070896_1003013 [Candidatus Kentron sp. H]VFJ93941.1 MAG: hypothetical protein BECKH772B_GA0070898_100534 [Candidatus Kentron sp. H]VFJ99178.1 MAG: hypothetical protein BECKH772C_GA0070978_1002920 [Candidatus Kentron sp. H]